MIYRESANGRSKRHTTKVFAKARLENETSALAKTRIAPCMKQNFSVYRAFFILSVFALTGCFERNSSNPANAYQFWAGEPPDKYTKVINGKYWQSSHFTKEYILYLEIIATAAWRKKFIEQNKLIETSDRQYPKDAPTWFKPPDTYRVMKPRDFDQETRYFEDSTTNHIYIYEIQL
jgi:hypothetical protein